jgi:hypothetical protein
MNGKQKRRTTARPPWRYSWIEDFDDMEKLGVIYAKLLSVADSFSAYSPEKKLRTEAACNVYGFWFILAGICDELADILKLKKWYEEADQQSA